MDIRKTVDKTTDINSKKVGETDQLLKSLAKTIGSTDISETGFWIKTPDQTSCETSYSSAGLSFSLTQVISYRSNDLVSTATNNHEALVIEVVTNNI